MVHYIVGMHAGLIVGIGRSLLNMYKVTPEF